VSCAPRRNRWEWSKAAGQARKKWDELVKLADPFRLQGCHSAPSRQVVLLQKCHTANKFVNSRRFGLDQATVQLSAAVMIHGDSGARVMRTITILGLILIGLASTPAFSSPVRPGRSLFDEIVPRPPRAIPNVRRHYTTTPMPRAKPQVRPTATALPSGPITFPPVAPLE
jgi:hypothetical protein